MAFGYDYDIVERERGEVKAEMTTTTTWTTKTTMKQINSMVTR